MAALLSLQQITKRFGAIIIAAIPPRVGPDNLPNPSLYQNPDYMNGYKKGAHNKKIGKAATGFGIGMAFWIAVLAVTISNLN